MITKHFHFDKLSYKDVFYSLRNLRTQLIKDDMKTINLPDISLYCTHLKKSMYYEIIHYLFKDTNINVHVINREKYKPETKEEIEQILKENHDSKLAGHSGYTRTYKRIKESYKWNNMKKDIKKYIKRCPSCQINKTNYKPNKAPMEITSTSQKAFERLAIDIVGPLPITENGNRFILTMQDDLTKYSYAVPVQNHEAHTIANELTKFIVLFGIPTKILSDQGSDFMSKLIKELFKLFKIGHLTSSPYHPQTNGALERSHLTLKEYLKHYINNKQNNWDELIPFAMFAYNTHIHTSTNFSPYELLFGNKAYLPTTLTQEPEFNYSYDDYVTSLKQKLNLTQTQAKENIIKSKLKSKEYYDQKIKTTIYKPNDLVYILNKQVSPGLSKKLSPNFKGPYNITKVLNEKNVQIQIGKRHIIYHTNMIKPFVSD